MSNLFSPQEYPDGFQKAGVFGFMNVPDIEHLWLEFRTDNRIHLMYGILDESVKAGYDRAHSKLIGIIQPNVLGTGHHKTRDHTATWKLTKEGGDLYIDLGIKFNRSARDDIYDEGLLISNADYRYLLGLIKRRKANKGSS